MSLRIEIVTLDVRNYPSMVTRLSYPSSLFYEKKRTFLNDDRLEICRVSLNRNEASLLSCLFVNLTRSYFSNSCIYTSRVVNFKNEERIILFEVSARRTDLMFKELISLSFYLLRFYVLLLYGTVISFVLATNSNVNPH